MIDVKQFSHRDSESRRKKQMLFSASLWLRGKMRKVNK